MVLDDENVKQKSEWMNIFSIHGSVVLNIQKHVTIILF